MQQHKPVEHIKIGRNQQVDDLLKQFKKTAFSARNTGESADLLENMIKDKECVVFLSLAGAMTPAGMKEIIHDILRNGWIDAISISGANLTHDLVEALGHSHFQLDKKYSDKKLRDENAYRIYDHYMPGDVYEKLEDFCRTIFDKIPQHNMGISEFLRYFGEHCPENTILNICAKNKIPVFCPALVDSGLGMQIWFNSQDHKFKILALEDLKDILDITWPAKRLGAFIIGGGVPKNYILQAFQFSQSAKYIVQITTDREEYGGLSGATPSEAISWGKIAKDANTVDIRCDATLVLPLLYSALLDRLK